MLETVGKFVPETVGTVVLAYEGFEVEGAVGGEETIVVSSE